MRLLTGSSNISTDEIKQFSKWVLQIGDGVAGGPNDGEATIRIPDDFLIRDMHDPLAAIVSAT